MGGKRERVSRTAFMPVRECFPLIITKTNRTSVVQTIYDGLTYLCFDAGATARKATERTDREREGEREIAQKTPPQLIFFLYPQLTPRQLFRTAMSTRALVPSKTSGACHSSIHVVWNENGL